MSYIRSLLLVLLLSSCAPISVAAEAPVSPIGKALSLAYEEFVRTLPERVADTTTLKEHFSDPQNYWYSVEITEDAFKISITPKPYEGNRFNATGPNYYVSLDGETLIRSN